MKSFATIDIEKNGNYLTMLSAISKLSRLFSDSSVPFINYRVVENIFCRSFKAQNISRSDTAFDAKYNKMGVGIKTFVSSTNQKFEKVAEFNSLSKNLQKYKDEELALKLSEYRNERINLASRLYGVQSAVYHIVARKEKELLLFETDYNKIKTDRIRLSKKSMTSLQFDDGSHQYSYNFSKSTLFRKFSIPNNAYRLPVEIINDPYSLLIDFIDKKETKIATDVSTKGIDYVVLPLYSIKKKEKFVFTKSGLNQWNARGRKRDIGELYISIPKFINKSYPHFFPKRDQYFNLEIPTGQVFTAKVCQDNSKAIMTNPNKLLSDWLLRNVLNLDEGELATIEKLDEMGVDSVIISKKNDNYCIDIMKTDSYERFLEE